MVPRRYLYPTNLIERILKPMIIDKVASETIGKMLKEGYDLSLNITSWPDQEDGIESYAIMFYTKAFLGPNEHVPTGDIRDFLMAYSGNGRGTVSDAIEWAANEARLATAERLTFTYKMWRDV